MISKKLYFNSFYYEKSLIEKFYVFKLITYNQMKGIQDPLNFDLHKIFFKFYL